VAATNNALDGARRPSKRRIPTRPGAPSDTTAAPPTDWNTRSCPIRRRCSPHRWRRGSRISENTRSPVPPVPPAVAAKEKDASATPERSLPSAATAASAAPSPSVSPAPPTNRDDATPLAPSSSPRSLSASAVPRPLLLPLPRLLRPPPDDAAAAHAPEGDDTANTARGALRSPPSTAISSPRRRGGFAPRSRRSGLRVRGRGGGRRCRRVCPCRCHSRCHSRCHCRH